MFNLPGVQHAAVPCLHVNSWSWEVVTSNKPPRPPVLWFTFLFDKTMICKTCTIGFPKSIQNDNRSVINKINERKSNAHRNMVTSPVCVCCSVFLSIAIINVKPVMVCLCFPLSSSVLLSDEKCENWKAKNNIKKARLAPWWKAVMTMDERERTERGG